MTSKLVSSMLFAGLISLSFTFPAYANAQGELKDAIFYARQDFKNGQCVLKLDVINRDEQANGDVVTTLEVLEKIDQCNDGFRCPEEPEIKRSFSTLVHLGEEGIHSKAVGCEVDWEKWKERGSAWNSPEAK